jgi:hypothetical protein
MAPKRGEKGGKKAAQWGQKGGAFHPPIIHNPWPINPLTKTPPETFFPIQQDH